MSPKVRRNGRHYGKLSPREMERYVFGHLGSKRSDVLRGPSRGFDNAVLLAPGGESVIVTADPVSIIPAVGMKRSAWMSVHLIASDHATSGVAPEFASFTFNFPAEVSARARGEYLRSVGDACGELGVAVVAGHTGAYPSASFTVVGGGTMFGFSKDGKYVDPSMARPGDTILMTKGAAIEATASLAWAFPRHLEEAVGRNTATRAKRLLESCSVYLDATTAAEVGLGKGMVTSMHDATEGGVLGAVSEMADASGSAFLVDRASVRVSEEAKAVCGAFGIDPMTSLGEGALLITCAPEASDEVSSALSGVGIECFEVGRVVSGSGVWSVESGRKRRIHAAGDGYWGAYAAGVRSGLT